MSTTSLPTSVITRARELFTLYSKKGAFQIEEYADAGAVYKRLTDAGQGEDQVDVTEVDVKYIVSAINVCSTRVPTEVQNYKPISDLLDTLSSALKALGDEEETKTEL